MNHLSSDELVDLVEGTIGAERLAHVQRCAACGVQAEQLRTVLRDAKALSVPEPSPLFWQHFSARVNAALAADEAPRPQWLPAWFGWRVLAPLAALALMVFALATSVPRDMVPTQSADVTAAGASIDLASVGEQEWAVLSEIVGPVDLDAAQDAGIVRLGDAERAALQLSAAEQRELVRLLEAEINKAGG